VLIRPVDKIQFYPQYIHTLFVLKKLLS